MSLHAEVDASGNIDCLSFDRYSSLVKGRRYGMTQRPAATSEVLGDPAFRGSIRRFRARQAPVEDDIVAIAIAGPERIFASGPAIDFPASAKSWLAELDRACRTLPPAKIAPGYVRVETVSLERKRWIEARGRKFTRWHNIPAPTVTYLSQALRDPGGMIPIGEASLPALRAILANSEFFERDGAYFKWGLLIAAL